MRVLKFTVCPKYSMRSKVRETVSFVHLYGLAVGLFAKTRTETAETAKNNAKEASGTVKKAEGTTTSETSDGQLSDQDFYVVQKGETLAGISQKLYGDTSHVKAICKMNGLSDGNLIYIGQKLLLP